MTKKCAHFFKVCLCLCLSLTFVTSISFAQSGQSPEASKTQLERMNVPYTVDAFFEKIKIGDSAIVKLFLQSGMDINIKDKEHRATPLHWAALEGQLNVAKLLLEKGAEVNSMNKDGGTPLSQAAIKGNTEIGKLLIDNGAKVDWVDTSGITPLIAAAGSGHTDFVNLLLNKGADVNIKASSGMSAIDAARKKGHPEIASFLMSAEDQKHQNVTSDNLAAGDVEWALKNGFSSQIGNDFFSNIHADSIKVIGVHQQGNKAVIYVEYKPKQVTIDSVLMGPLGSPGKGEVVLVRLNSGEWLFPSTKKVLKK